MIHTMNYGGFEYVRATEVAKARSEVLTSCIEHCKAFAGVPGCSPGGIGHSLCGQVLANGLLQLDLTALDGTRKEKG